MQCALERRHGGLAASGPDDHVLDVGCGAGAVVRLSAGRAGQAIGVAP